MDSSVVRIFDTTLRDGEQSPGFSMNTEEKIRMARQLAALGVDVIEAGFPISSRGDLEAVQRVAREVRNVPIAALARAKKLDVEAAIEALEPAAAPRLHIFLATSDLHLRVKLNMTREQALEAISSMIRLGRKHVGEVEFSAEDAGRTDIGFLCQVCQVAVDAGATVLNLPDTVGYAVPERYYPKSHLRGRDRLLPRLDLYRSESCQPVLSGSEQLLSRQLQLELRPGQPAWREKLVDRPLHVYRCAGHRRHATDLLQSPLPVARWRTGYHQWLRPWNCFVDDLC
jgi:hypothetical protein